MGGIRITVDSETGMKIDMGRRTSLDVSDMPRFQYKGNSMLKIVESTLVDFSLLVLYTIAALVGAFFVFLRYDVR